MAFTVSEDHEAQQACWQSLPEWNRDPSTIHRALMAQHVEGSDKRVRFVDIETYTAGGGQVVRDLFQERHQGWLIDPALLERLAGERLEREAEALRGQGWKWVAIHPDLDWETLRGFERVHPERKKLSRKQQQQLQHLGAEYDRLAEDEEANAERLRELAGQIEALQAQEFAFIAEQIAASGVLIGISHDGSLQVERGLLRHEDQRGASTKAKALPTLPGRKRRLRYRRRWSRN
jgi:ParB family transcriptional regulator, chromosome partitioning protein